MLAKTYATEIVQKLVAAGYTAYFAGGWVRDFLLGHPSADIDIATDAPIPVILDLFPHTILVGLAFGVVIVVKDGLQFEVATFRRDINYMNGRSPEKIEPSTPREDAQRRDFTINGMFYDPLTDEIYDFVGGVTDLKMGVIRAIGDPYERFVEDRLRMIRAVRFACRFGFLIDPTTHEAIIENADTLLPSVAMERVWQELKKMSDGQRFEHALIELHSCGLLEVIFPSLKGIHHKTIKHGISLLNHFPLHTPLILKLEILFPEATLESKLELCQMLRTSKRESLLLLHADLCRRLLAKGADAQGVDWAHFHAKADSPIVIEAVMAVMTGEEKQKGLKTLLDQKFQLQRHIDRIITNKPIVTSDLLRAEGIPNGKLMGLLLKEAETIAINNDIEIQEEILKRLRLSPLWPLINKEIT
jgi:poly(A) polymerase